MTARYLMAGQLAFLARSGFDVRLITSPGPHLDAVRREQGVECLAVPILREIRPLADIVSLLRLTRLLRRIRPTVVNASTPKAGLLGMLAATLAGVPIRLYTLRGLRLETTGGLKRTFLTLGEKMTALCAHRIVPVSPSLQRRYIEHRLAPRRKIFLLGAGSSNGIDCARFRPPHASENLDLVRADLDLQNGRSVIGFVGRLVKDKGIEDLVRAFDQLVLERFPGSQLLLVGDFETGDQLDGRARDFLATRPEVRIAGFLTDTASAYRVMDVLAFPSYREGLPNVPLEAAATALPVVGYAATGTVDAVEDGVTGLLVPIGDWRALGEALCRYLEDSDVRHRHGAAARQRVIELFSQEKVWRSWRDLYCDLLPEAVVRK